MSDIAIATRGVTQRFGGLMALHEVNFEARRGTVAGIIGPNGAGKSTLFGVMSGFITPTDGSVWHDGHDITRLRPDQVASRGVARSFQRPRPLMTASAIENVVTGAYRHGQTGMLGTLLASPRARTEDREARRKARNLLEIVGLSDVAERRPSELTGGQLRMLEIARAMAARPDVMLLDEPAAGLTRQETATFGDVVSRYVEDTGATCVLIEHDVDLVFEICHDVTVLQSGAVLVTGPASEVHVDPTVRAAYLGTGDSHQDHAAQGQTND